MLKKYYENRNIFKIKILKFFNEINFKDFTETNYMFSFINNKQVIIITYDIDYSHMIETYHDGAMMMNVYSVDKFDEFDEFDEFLIKLSEINIIKKKLRKHKLVRVQTSDFIDSPNDNDFFTGAE